MQTTARLMEQLQRAEEAHRTAVRRCAWLTRRVMEADTLADFDARNAELIQAERLVQAAAVDLIQARHYCMGTGVCEIPGVA